MTEKYLIFYPTPQLTNGLTFSHSPLRDVGSYLIDASVLYPF